jgi:diacylglycerol O-acyltransferase / wax synthase
MAAAEIHPALGRIPNANVLISNMIGPDRQLYLAGARLCGFHGLPILPPGMGLNVTFVSIADSICLGIGAAPEAVANPYRVIELVEQTLQELAESLGQDKADKPRVGRSGGSRSGHPNSPGGA